MKLFKIIKREGSASYGYKKNFHYGVLIIPMTNKAIVFSKFYAVRFIDVDDVIWRVNEDIYTRMRRKARILSNEQLYIK